MKMYVIPVGTKCNATCNFCITKYRDFAKQEFLEADKLQKSLDKINPDYIEITGGGEPLLHPEIEEIVDICLDKTKTQIYTNGVLTNKILDKKDLDFICLSRAHYDDEKNKEIMGISYDHKPIFESEIQIKLSLLLHKSGINSTEDIDKYFDWAVANKAKKVVVRNVRELFEHDYKELYEKEFVSTEEISEQYDCLKRSSSEYDGSTFVQWRGMLVEFELMACSCELTNPVLHADGKVHIGWSDEVLK